MKLGILTILVALFYYHVYHHKVFASLTVYKVEIPRNLFCPVHLYFATSRITCASACTLKEGGSPRMAIHFEEYQCECGQAFCLNLSEVDTPIKVFVHDICDKLDGN